MVPQLLLHKSLIFQPGTGCELGYDIISIELGYAVANVCELEHSELGKNLNSELHSYCQKEIRSLCRS